MQKWEYLMLTVPRAPQPMDVVEFNRAGLMGYEMVSAFTTVDMLGAPGTCAVFKRPLSEEQIQAATLTPGAEPEEKPN